MTDKQKNELIKEIYNLIGETEGYDDAKHYLQDVVDDVGCTKEEALEELKRQFGRSY